MCSRLGERRTQQDTDLSPSSSLRRHPDHLLATSMCPPSHLAHILMKYRTPKYKEESGTTSPFLEEKMTSKAAAFALLASFATPEKLWRGKTDRVRQFSRV